VGAVGRRCAPCGASVGGGGSCARADRDPASLDARRIGRDGGRIDEKQSFREYGHPAMDLSKIDGTGKPAIGTVF
jgi:hypothetical protein